VPQLGISVAPAAMRRFWTMLAHYHGQTWNPSELARAMGLTDKTVQSYLDLLTGTFMVRQLQPWHENLAKRQIKAPKVYLRDTGLLHGLLDLSDVPSLTSHPRWGRPGRALRWNTCFGSCARLRPTSVPLTGAQNSTSSSFTGAGATVWR
jgi:predicted AAA+ superfamily ATPase